MAGTQRTVSVTTSATRLDTADESDSRAGSSLVVTNNGAATAYWGYTSGVTTANGTPLAAAGQFSVQLDEGEQLWAIAASGTLDFRVAEKGI